MISSMAMKRGRPAGIAASAGIGVGNMTYATLSIFGLSYMLARMAWLLTAIKIVGGLYLLYLAYQLWRSSFTAPAMPTADMPVKKKNPFLIGVTTNITNPKALAFFTSVFALILSPDLNLATRIAIIALIGGLSFAWFGFVTYALSTSHMRKLYIRGTHWIDRIAGTFLALFGIKLLASARS
ncbi:MAG TPA: LysE family transporter [Alphaproteobacteria bacterium]|nr:LysE family transporter [Alphaproteobacteria bacterium]